MPSLKYLGVIEEHKNLGEDRDPGWWSRHHARLLFSRLDMGADGIYVGGVVDPQNGAAEAASIGAAAATFNPGGGVDTTERIF